MDQSAGPSVFKNPIHDITQVEVKKDTFWFRKNLVKIVIVALIILVTIELVFSGMTLFSPSSSNKFNILGPKISPITQATLSLVADSNSYKVGDQISIDVQLSTGGLQTDSTDLVVKYNPLFLEPSANFAQTGSLYSEYPAVQIDREKGQIGISGITLPERGSFSGTGSFAMLYFKTLKEGQTQVTIDFEKGETADSNVVLTGSTNDVLGSVKNTDIVILGSK